MVGTMLIKQPFLITGIEDIEKAKGNAFGAAGTFFLTFIISIIYLIKESGRQIDTRIVRDSSSNYNGLVRGEYSGISLTEAQQQQQTGGGYRDDPDESYNNNIETNQQTFSFDDEPFGPTNAFQNRRPYRDNPELI